MDGNEGDFLTFTEFNVRTPFCSLEHYKYIGHSAKSERSLFS